MSQSTWLKFPGELRFPYNACGYNQTPCRTWSLVFKSLLSHHLCVYKTLSQLAFRTRTCRNRAHGMQRMYGGRHSAAGTEFSSVTKERQLKTSESPKVVLRSDYEVPAFLVDNVALEFDLEPDATRVKSRLQCRRNEHCSKSNDPLVLDGEDLKLNGVWVDGKQLGEDQFSATPSSLTISEVPDEFQVEVEVTIAPAANTSLYGLYQSSGNYCTQCEAMGFRRITYFFDRPDVMARYRVTIRGSKEACPVMLSNGNRVSERDLDDGRHEVTWEDPFPKPSYLFALVAGDLRCHGGTFTTRAGRDVQLEIWVEPQNIESCEHALRSLQKAMKWDEEVFGLEYDLDIYMIVAVNDFNMGAMENKGLNIFNSKYVLARPETATDADYEYIEAVIAHEYFHNWTGNRVTCRDWFQLTLKEGLTVFRDQQFTADQTSAAVKRIDDVNTLRSRQFPEDAGPMAHPIRPESYIAMDNFYTATVYCKGAEIIRMYHTLLGPEGFRRGMDLYFQRHDGDAVTCDDFRAAMADANDVRFDLFDRWYSQPGTPVLEANGQWIESEKQYTLSLEQHYPQLPEDIPGVSGRKPVPMPVAVGLLDSAGHDLPLRLVDEDTAVPAGTRVLLLDTERADFVFTDLESAPIASLLRGFSAPAKLKMDRSRDELAFLMAHDSDPFNRWDAGETLAAELLLELAAQAGRGEALVLDEQFSEAFGRLLADDSIDGSFKALALRLPSEGVLAQDMHVVDPDGLHQAREFARQALAELHFDALYAIYSELAEDGPYCNDQASISRRRLKNVVLAYLATLNQSDTTALVMKQFDAADNMTDSQAALTILADLEGPERDTALAAFYDRWRTDPLVLDKWFSVQAISKRIDTLRHVIELTQHEDFSNTNPNRVRALLGAFASQNQVHFHQQDGQGYALLTGFVLQIDPLNPQLASRLVSEFNNWTRFDTSRQDLQRRQLDRIAGHEGLSKDVHEIVERALKFAD